MTNHKEERPFLQIPIPLPLDVYDKKDETTELKRGMIVIDYNKEDEDE